jgi:hypothetical protein
MSMSWWSAFHVVRVRFICVTPFLMAMLGACGAEAVKEVVLPAEPKFIDAAFPPALVIDDAWYDLDPYVGDAGGHRIVELSVAISAGPSGVVEIEGTRVRCKASGDGIVRFSSGTLESQHKLTCMPIKRIDVKHPSVQLWTGADGVALGARAVNEKGVLVPGVDVERTVLNPDVVRLDGDSVHPIQVGRTAIKLAAGDIERSIDVVVGARYDHRIKVPDGERWALSLSPGAYTVDIQVESSGTAFGVAAKWTGAQCKSHPEAQVLHLSCATETPATLEVVNPTAFGLGPTSNGVVKVEHLPL